MTMLGQVPCPKTRKEYVERCKLENMNFRDSVDGQLFHQYKNDGKGRRVGVACAYTVDGLIYIGASKCNRTLRDKFDPHIGLHQAIAKAVPITSKFPETFEYLQEAPTHMREVFYEGFPTSMHKLVCRMIFRARRQFAPKPEKVPEPAKAE